MTSTGIEPVGATEPPETPLSSSPPGDGLLDGRDFAGRQSQGARKVQEDSYGVVPRAEFNGGPTDLFLVVADGMGGHAAGEVASSLAVQTFAETFLESSTACDAGRLWDCLDESNRRIAREIQTRGEAVEGMGTTLLAVLLRGRTARWISVGDSPLYLIRAGELRRLNRIHSKATELAEQVQAGLITEEQARTDPARHELLSALIGDSIYDVDDPPPIELLAGDVLIAATDGIESLTHQEIVAVVTGLQMQDAAALAESLLQAVHSKQFPKQDNTTAVVLRIPE
jgi:serine/threonine protein phosphatase PrpC